MDILKNFKFNVIAFIISFCVGLVYIYFTNNEQKVIIKYPTPMNVGKTVYKDDNGVCYKYHIKKVECPEDTTKIKNVDIQTYKEENI